MKTGLVLCASLTLLVALTLGISVGPSKTAAQESKYKVSSRLGWQQAPLNVRKGMKYSVEYYIGDWTVDYRNFDYVGPQGYPSSVDSQIYQGCKLDPNWPYAMLIGKVGTNGQLFSVGGKSFSNRGDVRTFTATTNGSLYLRIHDDDRCLGDNGGSITVNLASASASPPPKPQPPQPQPPDPPGEGTRVVKNDLWAGYVGRGRAEYTSVTGWWQVPKVSCTTPLIDNTNAAAWVGLGGVNVEPLEQIATLSSCVQGVPYYSAAWQMLPGGRIHYLPPLHPVSAGDNIEAEVTHLGNGDFKLWMRNNTKDWEYSTTQHQSQMTGALSSAECILEAPPGWGEPAPLPNFGTIHFEQCFSHGAIGKDPSLLKLIMTTSDGKSVRAQPSDFLNPLGISFDVKWVSRNP